MYTYDMRSVDDIPDVPVIDRSIDFDRVVDFFGVFGKNHAKSITNRYLWSLGDYFACVRLVRGSFCVYGHVPDSVYTDFNFTAVKRGVDYDVIYKDKDLNRIVLKWSDLFDYVVHVLCDGVLII